MGPYNTKYGTLQDQLYVSVVTNIYYRQLPDMEISTLAPRLNDCVELSIHKLRSPSWVLRPIDPRIVAELARSIETSGLLQPILARERGDGYEVVFGNHRLEACKQLGMKTIPTIVQCLGDAECFLARVSENLVRNSYVNPIEEAKGYKMLVAQGWSIDSIGRRVGKSDSYVCERLALLDRLDDNLQSKIENGSLTPSHGELLARIRSRGKRTEIAELIEKKRLSVRTVEEMLRSGPLPERTRAERVCDELCIRIPNEFAEAAGISDSQPLYMYLSGNKLILENVNNHLRRKDASHYRGRSLPSLLPISS